jgi:hypothetical protein
MPGAWEIGRPSVLVATLTRELVSTKWAVGYRNLQLPPDAGTTIKSGAPFDTARNMACEDVLQHNFTWLFFLDDDVVTPPDAYHRLAAHGKDIISGLYYRRAEPIVPVMMKNNDKGQAVWITQWSPPRSLIEVDLVGAGCLLIHRRVLERMKPPWFEWQIGREDPKADPTKPPQNRLSEDFAFCQKAKREYGFSVFVDTSIECEHIGLAESVGGGLRPSHA